MQGGRELEEGGNREPVIDLWNDATKAAVEYAEACGEWGLHKSVVNRLLEPFMWHTIVCSGTAFSNFFEQRCSPLAQPEIRVAAEMMKAAYDASTPKPLGEGEWHLPYIGAEDWEALFKANPQSLGRSMYPEMVKVSAARCARVSYLTHDGKRDIEQDLDLYEKLTTAKPAHWSPLEHVATPWAQNRQGSILDFKTGSGVDTYQHVVTTDHLPKVGNLLGWRSLRTEVEAQQGAVTFR